jgi:hypothetical protein
VAFAYATGVRAPLSWQLGPGWFTWLCGSCGQLVADRGPAEPDPALAERGHAADCDRHLAEVAAYQPASPRSVAYLPVCRPDGSPGPESAQLLLDVDDDLGQAAAQMPASQLQLDVQATGRHRGEHLAARLRDRGNREGLPPAAWSVSWQGYLLGACSTPDRTAITFAAWRQAMSAWLGRGPDADSEHGVFPGTVRMAAQWASYEHVHVILTAVAGSAAGA